MACPPLSGLNPSSGMAAQIDGSLERMLESARLRTSTIRAAVRRCYHDKTSGRRTEWPSPYLRC